MKISLETRMKQAQEAIDYYERLLHSQNSGQNWALGLFMSQQWRRMLQEEKPDLQEVRLFFMALKNDWGIGNCGGSQWCSLCVQVGHWLESLEQPNKQSNASPNEENSRYATS